MRALIGRNTVYGNPCSKQGHKCGVCGQNHKKAGDSINCYRKYLWGRIQKEKWAVELAKSVGVPVDEKKPFDHQLMDLQNKALFCPGCKDDAKTCHARVLERAVIWALTNVNMNPSRK